MKKLFQILFLFGSTIGISSCVDEINLALEESNQAIVIDAWMGNTPEDTYVKVYRTSPYVSGSLNPAFLPVQVNAVFVEKTNGEEINFSLSESNDFRPSEPFEPQEGETYKLVVKTSEGEIFESAWETMPPKVEIEDIVTKALERQVMITTGQTQFFQVRTFADVQAQISDPGVGELGYMIETSGITELFTSSSNDNCACACYENDPNIFAGMNLTPNSSFRGNNFGLSVGEIPLSYLGRYLVSSKLKVLTKSSFEYLSQVDRQQRSSGSIFDPAPFRIKGNIKKRGDENQLVLGGFFLYQESAFEKLLYRTQIRSESLNLNHTLESIPVVEIRCDEFYTNATPVVPPSFKP
ncbi:MAG TPA: DUF4249 domain-containing protein [Algoriphagus sp.]|nr:DUF4249 domain-containing protein [Algoriphagus sp.]